MQSNTDLYRDFQANPTSVELALRYWNAFLRSDAPREFAGIDINDPSPRNWKAIVRLIAKLDCVQREPVIEVLKAVQFDVRQGAAILEVSYVE